MTKQLSRRDLPASEAALYASIAHEINQPLAAIVANASACRNWLAASPPDRERLEAIVERIIESAVSASETVRGLRALFAHEGGGRAFTQLNDVIEEVCAAVAHDAEPVQIVLRLDRALPALVLDRAQIRQVLVNLVRNGAEAMETSQGRMELHSRPHKGGAWVEVRDEGSGVVDAARIFDPFFSTKPDGMGMGLALCRRIVEAHGGRLWTEPCEPAGTRMIFTLPGVAQ